MEQKMADTKDKSGSERAAQHIIRKVAENSLTKDSSRLAKYIDEECGIRYLIAACQAALTLDAVTGEVEQQIRLALLWAGAKDE
jgi:hypothetical protein